jgi:CBS domain-containing protein
MTESLSILLEGIPAFRDLPPDALATLEAALTRRTVPRGEYLFRQGEGPPESVFYLITGTAEILVGPPDEERVVSLSRPGQLVGWLTVFTTDPFPASARTVESTEVIQISSAVVRALLEWHPSVGRVLASTMARRLEDLFLEIRAEAAQDSASRAETFPFRKRVSEVMTSPALTLRYNQTARDAADAMGKARVSSVIVTDGEGPPLGIVTEKDLVQGVIATGKNPQTVLLCEVMSAPVAALEPQAYLYKALGMMRNRRVRHLAVVDGTRLLGMVSMRALMAMEKSETLELVEQIEGAETLKALAEAHQMSRTVCSHLIEEGVLAEEVSRLLSHINRDIHRRVLEMALQHMDEAGRGKPPVPFCFIVMGSHGRAENHLNTDQDHGMVLADYPPEEWGQVEPYFMDLASRLSEDLAHVGFTLCQGNVMSSNPVWRKPIREWREQVLGWYANPNSNAVRYTTLFYDFEPIWGDASLARSLREFITEGIQRNFQLLRSLFQEASHHKVPLTFFKHFVTERSGPHKGELDLKRSGLLFVVECSRILALRHGVTATSTLERLEALSAMGAIPSDEAEFVRTAYRTLFHFLLNAQVRKHRRGERPDNYVLPSALPIQERYMLRHALEATGRLQGMVHASFGDVFF